MTPPNEKFVPLDCAWITSPRDLLWTSLFLLVLTVGFAPEVASADSTSATPTIKKAVPNAASVAAAKKSQALLATQETHDRNVDRVALQVKNRAISSLKSLIERYKGTPKEPLMLMKLLDIQQEASGIEFRIAHAQNAKGRASLNRYNAVLNDLMNTATRIIDHFAQLPDLDKVYFTRGAAAQELDQKEKAQENYRALLAKYPHSSFAAQCYMALADFEIAEGHHQEAIDLLVHVEHLTHDPHYPFAIYKLAWAHYNLKEFKRAISYLVVHIEYYHRKLAEFETTHQAVSQAESAILEHSLLDLVSFYAEGFAAGETEFSPKKALATFQSLNPGPLLGPMVVRYAKVLRTGGRSEDLLFWKKQVMTHESNLPDALGVLLIAFDYFYNLKDFAHTSEIARDMVTLDQTTHQQMRTSESYLPTQHSLLETTERLQKMVLKNKNAAPADLNPLLQLLEELYRTFMAIVVDQDARVVQAHYNLAEVLFEVKHYEESTTHYRWILAHYKPESHLKLNEIALKAISARYKALQEQKIVPTHLTPVAPPTGITQNDTLKPAIAQWIHWIDEYNAAYPKDFAAVENFEFEADRTLYSQNQVVLALTRLLKLVEEHPDSKLFNPACSLILDSYITAQRWPEIYPITDRLIAAGKRSPKADPAFQAKLQQIGSDAFYKVIEGAYKAKDYDHALALVDQFDKKYPKNKRYGDVLFLASHIALDKHEPRKALAYLGTLVEEYPNSQNRAAALLVRATIEEQTYEFDTAASDYGKYLRGPVALEERVAIESRLMQMRWLAQRPSRFNCDAIGMGPLPEGHASHTAKDAEKLEELKTECVKFQALAALKWDEVAPPHDVAKKAMHGPKQNRTLWALLALKTGGKLIFHDRLLLSRIAASDWSQLDPLAQFATTPALTQQTTAGIAVSRKILPHYAPMRSSTSHIEHRIEFMNEIENSATQIVKLPWAAIKARVLGEVASMYLDFSDELAHMRTPRDAGAGGVEGYKKQLEQIIGPFHDKGMKLRLQALDVAVSSGVGRSLIHDIDPEFKGVKPEEPAKKADGKKGKKPEAKKAGKDSSAEGEAADDASSDEADVDDAGAAAEGAVLAELPPMDVAFFRRANPDWNGGTPAPTSSPSPGAKKKNADAASPAISKSAAQELADLIMDQWTKAAEDRDLGRLSFFIQELKNKTSAPPVTLSLMRAVSLWVAGAQAEALSELQNATKNLSGDRLRYVLKVMKAYYLDSYNQKQADQMDQAIKGAS